MSLYPKFDPEPYLQCSEGAAAKVANPAKEFESANDKLAYLAKLADPTPLETNFTERAAIIEFDASIPREWAEGFALLQCMERPPNVPEERWLQVIDDAGRFLDSWGAKLAALGWSTEEVLGVHPQRPEARLDSSGLVWSIRGRKVIAAAADRVAIEISNGNRASIYRLKGSEVVPVWELR